MLPNGKLFAWIKDVSHDAVQVCFVGASHEVASHADCLRAPASQRCVSQEDARRWVQREADAFGCHVEWVATRPDAEMRV